MKIILALLFLVTSQIAAKEDFKDYKTTFLLPIDWSSQKKLNLSVRIPEGYQSLQPTSSWDTAELLEFIPKDEEESNWSQIITIQKLINRQISAVQMSKTLLDTLSNKTHATLLLNEKASNDYETATFIISYIYEGKHEILGARYLSGPYDAVGVQYTIRLTQNQSEQEALEKIKEFYNNNLSIVEVDESSTRY